ncbi:MAG TPA: NADH-quinone oxidoreductase subunit C/D [Spirochaetia bacterium]|nr:NADH-quinone oxidoreductase subunit C/D [Spirochaetia bacterium]
MIAATGIIDGLSERIGAEAVTRQPTRDEVDTAWVTVPRLREALEWLKSPQGGSCAMLLDLTAIDERTRVHREGQPASDFTVVYHLCSLDKNKDVRIKVALHGETPSIRTARDLWPNADWYEREVWDLFGVSFDGHPHLKRILLPPWWEGHPLRKEYPARATEMAPFQQTSEDAQRKLKTLEFNPEEWGMKREDGDRQYMFVNIGPQHPATHGVIRITAQLDGEEIIDCVPDIGYHHRGAEKMGERQTWHTYIPYTDRIDYLGGMLNNFPYVLAVEKLAGIQVPERAQVIRIMMAELFRVISHLVYYGTFSGDVGQMSPVFWLFTDRERAFDIVEAVTGGRMHPAWFRIGGVAHDLPRGWDGMVRDFIPYMRKRIRDYEATVLKNGIFKARTKGIGVMGKDEAISWGATGPFLRGSGVDWDLRKKKPYGGYDRFEFDVPLGVHGDSYDRLVVHNEEMYQSLRIIEQCLNNMPAGDYKSDHPLTTPPRKERTMHDIDTLINHFLGVSWGPVMPPGEACMVAEGSKGNHMYYLVSDGGTMSYRTRIRTPSFAHTQMIPALSRGLTVPDLIVIIGSIDYVLADIDR